MPAKKAKRGVRVVTKDDRENRRDVTKALDLAEQIDATILAVQSEGLEQAYGLTRARSEIASLKSLLTDIDARTGRRDPSKR